MSMEGPKAIRALAIGVWAGTVLLAWSRPYSVDYETSLLPWLVSRGWVLYRDIADQHPPLFPVLLAVLGGAGDPGLPLQRVIVGLLGLTLALTYGLAARLAGPAAGLSALVLAALWLLVFDGTHLWYDSALAPVYLGVLLLLLPVRAPDADSLRVQGRRLGGPFLPAVALGALLGLGLLIKQHVGLAVPFVALAVALGGGPARGRRLAGFAVGLGAVLLGAGLVLAGQGALEAAWYWVVAYNFDGAYAARAARAPSVGEWSLLSALYAAVPAVLLAWLVSWWGSAARRAPEGTVLMVWAGCLFAATLPAWPRYGEEHLHAAIALLAVGGGAALVRLLRAIRPARDPRRSVCIALACAGLLLLGWSAFAGMRAGLDSLRLQALLGPPAAPYAATVPPLRAWVDAHAALGAPIVVYGLDSLLYRVLVREPPRPWVPDLPWMLRARDSEACWWAAVAQARVPVALVSASGWDLAVRPGLESGEARLRQAYHEAARFPMVVYHLASPVQVVGLLRNDRAPR